REYAAQKNRKVKCFLPLHSPLTDAGRDLIFPQAAAARLPVDGFLAEIRPPVDAETLYEGRPVQPFFESAWMQLTYFANLLDGKLERSLYFSLDGPETAPAQREKWWRAALAAALLVPQARGAELAAWPERFLPAAGAPAVS